MKTIMEPVGVELNLSECEVLFAALKLIQQIEKEESKIETPKFKNALDTVKKAQDSLQELCCNYNVSIKLNREYEDD